MNLDKLAVHFQRDRYGSFWLTEAIRPALDLQVIPEEGFRIDVYRDRRHRLRVPVLAAAVSREKLFDVFLALLEPLGELVDAVLETSHQSDGARHRDLFRERIDRCVLTSHLCDFEDLLLHDGCTGVAVIALDEPIEVQFDEHKSLLVYTRDPRPFEQIVQGFGLPRNDRLKLLSEGVHLHSSEPRHLPAFRQLCYRLGVGEAAEPVSW